MADGFSRMRWPVRRRGAGRVETVEDIAALEVGDPLPPPPVEEVPLEDPPQRFNLAVFRLAALGLALVLALALTMVKLFVLGPPSIGQLRAEAGVDGWATLPIGVKDDQPGLAFRNPKTNVWTGFDIDIAYMIAEDLGFRRDEVKFYAIESEDRARMQATDPANDNNRVPVKLVVASYSITEDRIKAGVVFSDPYFETEQSVLTLDNHKPVATFRDLAGESVCSLSASTSAGTLSQVLPRIDVVSKNQISDCITALDKHEVTAISTDASILGGFKNQNPGKYKHWDLGLDTRELYGVNVGGNKALQTLVNVTLYKSWKDPHDDRWELAYQNNIQPEINNNLPTPLAVAEQPPVARPDVRQLPWESELP